MTQQQPQILQAAAFMLAMGFMANTVNAMARYFSSDFSSWQMVFFYNILGLAFIAPFFLHQPNKSEWKLQWKKHALRAVLEAIGFTVLFHVLLLMPFPQVSAFVFMTPIIITVLAVLVLKERARHQVWVALAAGIAGMLVVVQPWQHNFNPLSFSVLISCVCFATCAMLIKLMTERGQSPLTIAFMMLFGTSILTAPMAIIHWQWPQAHHLPWLALFGLLTAATQWAVGAALKRAPVSNIAPLTFVNLIFSASLAWWLFDELIQPTTIIGAILIISGVTYNILISRRQHKKRIWAEANTGIAE